MDSFRNSLVCAYQWVTWENLAGVVSLVSLFASLVVCEAGGKDQSWVVPLWDLLGAVHGCAESVCGD